MAIRKAGDSMLQAAYRDILKGRDYRVVPRGDTEPLFARLQAEGVVQMSPQEMRDTVAELKGARLLAQLQNASPAARIQALTEAIQGGYPGAAMVFPVADRAGIYGASVIDGDRLIAHEIGNDATGAVAAFVPTAGNSLTHVIAEGGAIGDPMVYGTLSTPTARQVYRQALNQGYSTGSRGLLEDWEYSSPVAVGSQQDPYLRPLLSAVRGQNGGSPGQVAAIPFQIVASRGPGAQFDVYGMRLGGRTMATVQGAGEPGWLGNPYIANDAGGRYTRQEATDLFGQLIEEKAQDPAWRQAFMDLQGKRVGYYKPDEQAIHLHALQDWIRRNAGG